MFVFEPKLAYKTKKRTFHMINNDILTQFEQILSPIAGKGTNLALCDLWSAMASNHFSENRGAIFPAVEAYLSTELDCPDEIMKRTRRAAKALSNGSYALKEVVNVTYNQLVTKEGFQPMCIQGYNLVAIDFVGYQRPNAKSIDSKTYSSKQRKAVRGIPFGVATLQGECNGQRIAIPKIITCPDITKNDVREQFQHFYEDVSNEIEANEICIADAGFPLAQAIASGITNNVFRLSNNITFGSTPGKIPERKSNKGRYPTIHRPEELIRPLARKHKETVIDATLPDEIIQFKDENGYEVVFKVWEKLYFLESHLKNVAEEQKDELRLLPIKVVCIEHPCYEKPHLYGTTLQELEPENIYKIYTHRWPVEGVPQVGKRLLSGGGGRHFTHCKNSNLRLPVFSMLVGVILKMMSALLPPIPTGFWDRKPKSTFGRLSKLLKKVGIPLSKQLFKKEFSNQAFTHWIRGQTGKNLKIGLEIDPNKGEF